MVTRTWPVLQSFEKDQTRQNFVINQISAGLTAISTTGGGGDDISITTFPGIDLTGATDCAAAIQAAIDSIAVGGTAAKNLTIPAGSVLKIGTTLRIGNGTSSTMSTIQGVRIRGMGLPSIGGTASTLASTPVKFVWSGGASTMFQIAGPLVGWGLENLLFDGASAASIGLDVVSGQYGNCQNLTFSGCRAIGIRLTTFVGASFPSSGQSNSMHNAFINTWINVPDVAGAIGVLFTGATPGAFTHANSCYNTFINTTIWFAGTTSKFAVYFQACDSNYVINTHCVNGTNSAGVTLDYSIVSAWPSGNMIDGIDTNDCSTEFQSSGTIGQFARANYVRLFECNGADAPKLDNLVCLNNSESILPWEIATGVPDSLVLNYPQTFNAVSIPDGRLVFARAVGTNVTTNPLFQIQDHGASSGYASAPITKHGNQALLPGDIVTGSELILRYRTSVPCWELLNPAIGRGGRTRLTTATTFNVSTAGNDTTGTGSAGAPWRTIQHAFDVICSLYDTGGQTVTIQIANGTYTAGLLVQQTWIGGGSIFINGNAASPSSVVVNTASTSCFRNISTLPANIQIQNLTMTCGGAGNSCIDHAGTGTIGTGAGCIFGSAPLGHLLANGTGAIIFLNNAYTVTGGATYHWIVSGQGSISMAGFTVTISGSPALTYWALCQNCGFINSATTTAFSGSPAAGTQKYFALQNGVISSSGAVYPGSVAGAVTSGGVFV